jgi:molecular chaperone GrpE
VTHEERDIAMQEAAAKHAAASEPALESDESDEPELAAAREMAAESAEQSAAAKPDAAAPSGATASGKPDAAAPSGGAAPAAPEPDYKDQWLRAVAEVDNIRKRARRDVAVAESRGIAKLAREFLPALDNFERALAAAEAQPENRDHHLTDGIRLVQTELLAALARVGIEPDSPKGERFDPHRHEAVAQQPADGAEPGTIVEVYSAGYTYGDDVLRPAKVVVAG